MKLSLDYLNQRHLFWKNEIGETGIWDPDLFQDVLIQIKPKSKTYNGVFSRRWVTKKGVRMLVDKIFIYNNVEDFDQKFLDSVLVHEMIHQYIFQNKIKDTSTHGRIFKGYMARINEAFPEHLKINLKDHNPSIPLKGAGIKIHHLLFSFTDKDFYCCLIHPSKLQEFEKMAKRFKREGRIKKYEWAKSNDVCFDRYVRCTRTLHGIKKPLSELSAFCKEYNITTLER